MQRLSNGEQQMDVLKCLALKARDKDDATRTIALEALVSIGAQTFALETDRLMNIFKVNLLAVDGLQDTTSQPIDALACLSSAAISCKPVALTLQLFANFICGQAEAEPVQDRAAQTMDGVCQIDIMDVLERLDDIGLASMLGHHHEVFQAALCHAIKSRNCLYLFLHQAVDLPMVDLPLLIQSLYNRRRQLAATSGLQST